MEKIFLYLVAGLAVLFAISWSFNHINPWVSVVATIIVVYFLIKRLDKIQK
jgi:4-hydroxybenzoate polyprenyltransferase